RPVEACGDLSEFDWRNVVLYFALVDRFRDSDGQRTEVSGATDGDAYLASSGQYEGGDLQGVTERLDYLADLGVTGLWLSAPFDNRDLPGDALNFILDPNKYSGYHGYWPSPADIDWSQPSPRPIVEPGIGSAEDLRSLISSAHSSTSAIGGFGIKVLADYVMNHVDLASGLYQAHPDWFATNEGRFRLCGPENLWDHPVWGTRCAFADYLPPFDFDKPEVRAWSISDALWWATEFDFDGYRLDAIKHVPEAWLTELRAALSQRITDAPDDRFYLVGETFNYGSRSALAKFVNPETKLDGQFDFPMKDTLCRALFTQEDTLSRFANWMQDNDGFYGERAIMTTWIGNHDIPRAIHFASGEITNCRLGSEPGNGWQTGQWTQPTEAEPYERLALAFAVLFTNPGIPLLYYGDEVGLAGGGDPDNRRMMPWDDDPLAPALNPHQVSLRAKVRALARLRGENPVLGRGRRETLSADEDTWVYRMSGCLGAQDVLVAINRADTAKTVTLPAGTYDDLLDAGSIEGGALELPPRAFRVVRSR
ncbi:MAG: alpha-amylase family glycosyl hydrolase, partial [Myxococcota bacterium]